MRGDNDNIFISGFQFIKFRTEDKIINSISPLGHDMILTAIAIGAKNTYLFSLSNTKSLKSIKLRKELY